ncbi:hypothetical protein OG988_09190 [Streptomyces zaomyceticus]|uniref:hypothetical protein n=1 Tax=Streptomyces zaomyceticus TaxID=68286 RepID=UPI00324C14B9
MTKRVRRAAGTQTFADLLRNPKRVVDQFLADAPERARADVMAFDAGEPRAVTAYSREGGRFQRGILILDPAADSCVIWKPVRFAKESSVIDLVAPFRVHGVAPISGEDGRVDRDMFRLLSVEDSRRYWELAIPAIDVPLVRRAISFSPTVSDQSIRTW